MTKKLQIYKCEVCGNMVEVIHEGADALACCGKPMVLLEEKVTESGNEKHLPVVTVNGNKVEVKVGSIEHPMVDNHYIEWIEVIAEDGVHRKFLSPGEKPVAVFEVSGKVLEAREYCSIHGLWSKKL